MYEISIYEGNNCLLNKADFRYPEKIAGFLKLIKWNDLLEITIYHEGDVKYYIKYDDELFMAIEIFSLM